MNQNLIKGAAAQIDGAYGDIGANLSRHLGLIAQARASAVIPALAEGSTDLHAVFGFIEDPPAGQFYNSQATVAHGKLIHVHRKVQLATYGKLRDGLYYAAGTVCGSF